MALSHIPFQKYYHIRLIYGSKNPLGKSFEVLLSLFYKSVLINYFMWCSTLIILRGDHEMNPVPKSNFG